MMRMVAACFGCVFATVAFAQDAIKARLATNHPHATVQPDTQVDWKAHTVALRLKASLDPPR